MVISSSNVEHRCVGLDFEFTSIVELLRELFCGLFFVLFCGLLYVLKYINVVHYI